MKVICENQDGKQLKFDNTGPCSIESIDGLGSDFNVYTSKNTGQDGENYNGSDAKERNIVITLSVKRAQFLIQRNKMFDFFQKDSLGTLYYYEDDEAKKIEYYVEKVTPSGTGLYRYIAISLICPDPKFYDLTDQLTQLATWQGRITFPLKIHTPFVVAEKMNTLIGNIHNDSSVPMGLTVRFSASGEVTNPSLYDVNRHYLMQIGTTDQPMTMHIGDVIIVTTGEGNKRVRLVSGGTTTNVNNMMAYPPKWLKAYKGDNLFRYNADQGIDNLNVSILSTQAYWGA